MKRRSSPNTTNPKYSLNSIKLKLSKETIERLQKEAEAEIKLEEYLRKQRKKTKINQIATALKGFTKSFEIEITDNQSPPIHLNETIKGIENLIKTELTSMKGLKFVETLTVTFKKSTKDGTLYKTAYFNSKPQTIINNVEIPGALQTSKQQILNMIAQWVSEGSGWTIQSVDNHYLNIVQYEPMKGSSYIELPQELRNSRKGLINMKNEDNECFRWCHIRFLNP